MSGPLDTIDWRPESASRPDAAPADTRPAPSLWSQVAAAARVEADKVDDVQTSHRWDAYEPLVNALVERGVARKSLFDSPQLFGIDLGGEVPNWERIFAAAKKAGLQGIPATQEEFDKQAFRRMGGRDADQAVLARGSGAAAIGAQFVGGMAGSFADPINLYTLPLGGGGKTIAARILSEGLVNAGVEAVQGAGNAQAAARMGEDYTLGDYARDVGLAFAGGAVIRGGIEVAPGAARAAGRAIKPYLPRKPLDRSVAAQLAKALPEHLWTPDQTAAFHVLTRSEEVEAASPYVGTHSGFDTHAAKLAEAMDDIEAGRLPVERPSAAAAVSGGAASETRSAAAPRPNTGGKLHGGIVDFFVRNGLTEAQARGIAAGIHAESGSNPAALNEVSGAFGLGQWLGPRKRAIVERYGPHPTMEQQLEFVLWELRGGDHGGRAVLAHGDEASVLRSYIEDFMRPAKGRETSGDLQRGMDALGRGSEDLPLGGEGDAGALGDSGLSGAIAAEEADIAGRRAGLDSEPDVSAAAEPGELVARPDTGPAPEIDPDTLHAGLVDVLRPIVREGGAAARSLNRTAALAGELGVSEDALRGALDNLVALGDLRKTKGGVYRRNPVSSGEDDLVRFVARNGGLSYDGFSEAQRVRNLNMDNPPRGHDLKNSGYLDKFIPQVGPLLRPRGKGLDEMGELAWEAGYFGPVETTPRPTENELLDLLGELTRTGQKRMPGGATGETPHAAGMGSGPSAVRPDLFQDEEHYHYALGLYDAAARRLIGRNLDPAEFIEAFDANDPLPRLDALDFDERIDADIHAMINRRLDDALDDAFLEAEEDLYDVQAWNLAHAAAGEDPAGGGRGEGQAADAGNAGESGGGGEAGPRAAGSAELDRREAEGLNGPDIPESKAQAARFDSDAGDGVQAIAESDWHDIRAALDSGEAKDPAIAERQRQQAQLRAEAPMRAKAEQDGEMGLGLFDAADQPGLFGPNAALLEGHTFDLGDGKGPRTAAEIEAEIAADRAGLEEIRKCLK